MLATLFTAAAAAKWLVAAKIITTVGTSMVAISPIVEKMKKGGDNIGKACNKNTVTDK